MTRTPSLVLPALIALIAATAPVSAQTAPPVTEPQVREPAVTEPSLPACVDLAAYKKDGGYRTLRDCVEGRAAPSKTKAMEKNRKN